MTMDVADIADSRRRPELKIGVGTVAAWPLGLSDLRPALSVRRAVDPEFGIDIGGIGETARLVVGEIDLDRADGLRRAQVHRQRLARLLAARDPEGSRILVRSAAGGELAKGRGGGERLAVGEQHPAGEQGFDVVDLPLRCPVREVAEARRRPHLPVRLELRREQVDPSLERPVGAEPRRAGIPPIAVIVLEGGAVPGALDEPARLVGDRIPRRVSPGAERRFRGVGAVGIGVVLGARRAILEIIGAADLGHPRPFHERRDRGAVGKPARMVLPEPFPAVPVGVEAEHLLRRPLVDELAVPELDLEPVEREDVGRVPVEIPFAVIVEEQRRVPRAGRNLAGLHLVLFARADLSGQPRHAAHEIVEPAGLGRVGDVDRPRLHHRGHEIEPLAVRPGGGRDEAVILPSARRDEGPVDQIGRTPVTVGERLEEIIGPLVPHDYRIGTGAVRDALVHLLEIVAVIDVDRVGVGALARLRARRGGDQRGERDRQGGGLEHRKPHWMRMKRLAVSRP